MRGFLTGILVPTLLSLAVAAAVLAVGAGLDQVPASRWTLSARAAEGCYATPVTQIALSGVGGSVRLCVDGDAVTATMEAENLTVGDTYTLWCTYLDQERPRSQEGVGASVDERPTGVAGQVESRVVGAPGAVFSGRIVDLRPAARSEIALTLFHRDSQSAATQRAQGRQLLLPRPSAERTLGEGTTAGGEAGGPVARAVVTFGSGLRPAGN